MTDIACRAVGAVPDARAVGAGTLGLGRHPVEYPEIDARTPFDFQQTSIDRVDFDTSFSLELGGLEAETFGLLYFSVDQPFDFSVTGDFNGTSQNVDDQLNFTARLTRLPSNVVVYAESDDTLAAVLGDDPHIGSSGRPLSW